MQLWCFYNSAESIVVPRLKSMDKKHALEESLVFADRGSTHFEWGSQIAGIEEPTCLTCSGLQQFGQHIEQSQSAKIPHISI